MYVMSIFIADNRNKQ